MRGRLVEGRLQGYCEVFYADGSVFMGDFHMGSKVSGTFKFYDNSFYTGGFFNELFHGKGRFVYANGKIVEGNYCQGEPIEKAKIIYPNGDIYYGETKGLKKHGVGTLYFANHTKFMGNFIDGKIEGEGKFIEDGKVVEEGYWKNGKLISKDD